MNNINDRSRERLALMEREKPGSGSGLLRVDQSIRNRDCQNGSFHGWAHKLEQIFNYQVNKRDFLYWNVKKAHMIDVCRIWFIHCPRKMLNCNLINEISLSLCIKL